MVPFHLSFFIGGVILCLLCIADYRQKITRICNKPAYFSLLIVFLAINLAIYWLLCRYLAAPLFDAAENSTLSLATESVKDIPVDLQQKATKFIASVSTLRDSAKSMSYLAPPFIALAYFGLGSSTLNFGSVKIDFYNKLLQMVENLLPAKVSVWTDVKIAIRNGELQRQHMLQHLNSLRNEASRNHWDTLEDEWNDLETRSKQLDQRCDMLEKHLEILNSEKLDGEKIEWLKGDTLLNLNESRKRVLDLYKGYLTDFICVNLRDEGHIRSVLSQLGIPHAERKARPINVHYRCLIMGIIVGMLMGPISALSKSRPDLVPVMMVAGVVAIGLSNFIFSFIYKQLTTHEPLNSLYTILPIGLLAGYVGHFVFIIIQFVLSSKATGNQFITVPLFALLGGFYGAAIAFVLWVYNYWVLPRVKNGFLQVGLLGVGGSVALWAVVFPTQRILKLIHENVDMWGVVAVGFFVAVFLGYGLGLIGEGHGSTLAETTPHPNWTKPKNQPNTPSS